MDDEDDFQFGKVFARAHSAFKGSLNLTGGDEESDLFPNLRRIQSTGTHTTETNIQEDVKIEKHNVVEDNEVIAIDSEEDIPDTNQRLTRAQRRQQRGSQSGARGQDGGTGRARGRNRGNRGRGRGNRYVTPILTLSSDSESEIDFDKSQDVEEDINYQQTVLVKWNFVKLHKISMRRLQKLRYIQERLSELENVKPENIMLTLNDKLLNPVECLHSLDITVKDVIDAVLLQKPLDVKNSDQFYQPINAEKGSNEPQLSFKVQHKNSKNPILVMIRQSDKLSMLFEKVREELSMPLEKMVFKFDGEVLCPNKLASEQDLEGGECIDLTII